MPSRTCYHSDFNRLIHLSQAVCALVTGIKNWGGLGLTPWNGGRDRPLKHALSPICVTTLNLIVRRQTVWALLGVPTKLGCAGALPPWDRNVSNPLQKALPHVGYHVVFHRCRSNGTNIGTKIRRTTWVPRVSKGHSRSLELT